MISELQDKLEEANAKIKDLENRSRLYNVRIRGILETHIDLEGAIDKLMKNLTAPRSDGLPQDLIAKPHYYKIKEK